MRKWLKQTMLTLFALSIAFSISLSTVVADPEYPTVGGTPGTEEDGGS